MYGDGTCQPDDMGGLLEKPNEVGSVGKGGLLVATPCDRRHSSQRVGIIHGGPLVIASLLTPLPLSSPLFRPFTVSYQLSDVLGVWGTRMAAR